MNSFVRFILTLLVVGIAVNLVIVVMANRHSQAQQDRVRQQEREHLVKVLTDLDNSRRRAHISVEWQQINSSGDVLKTSVLIRRYFLMGNSDDHGVRPPLVRVVIAGDRLYFDALALAFSDRFAEDEDDLTVFRGRRLAFFGRIFGEGQNPDDGFNFRSQGNVPEVVRIFPEQKSATYYETQMWHRIWLLVEDTDARRTAEAGLTVEEVPAKSIVVTKGKIYAAVLGPDGLTLTEDTTTSGVQADMENEARQLDAQSDNGNGAAEK